MPIAPQKRSGGLPAPGQTCDPTSGRLSIQQCKIADATAGVSQVSGLRLTWPLQKRFSEMESEKACDYYDYYDYADDVENVHCTAPIEELCLTTVVLWM
jgi:hypothetical protein